MTGATLFSGIGAPEVAMPDIDWRWCAEIEPFPSMVLAERHGTPNLGDVTAADFIARARSYGPLDLLAGGSPCQSFSVAGLRGSLSDSRGNLTLRFVEIVHATDPRSVLWENVPGVLNTEDNAFGCFLGGLVGADAPLVPARGQRWTDAGMVAGPKRTAAWRILDAQYFGLAQRRERVFLVSGRAGDFSCAQVLFEPESLRRNLAPSRTEGQSTTGTLSVRTSGGGGPGTDFDLGGGLIPEVSYALNAHGGAGRCDGESETFIAHTLRADGFDASEDGTGRGTPLVADLMPTMRSGSGFKAGHGARSGDSKDEYIVPAIAFNLRGREGGAMPEPSEVASVRSASGGSSRSFIAGPMCAAGGTEKKHGHGWGQQDWESGYAIPSQMGVRRLTPVECERLQGYRDGFTQVVYRGKPAADGNRYKALGNSMAVPVVRWILTRMAHASAQAAHAASSHRRP